jgi:DNA (cytosine-5)-methyltransferase 1
MRHGSLFSGIGGFDLAAQWMGWENVFQVEWDKWCQKVLEKNFPDTLRFGDIVEFNKQLQNGKIDCNSEGNRWKVDKNAEQILEDSKKQIREYGESFKEGSEVGCEFGGHGYNRSGINFRDSIGRIDILTGGFPCQPFSHAGKRKGTDDSRYLWPEMLTTIRILKPSFVIGENVTGLVSMENGKTLDGILADLENEGYTTEQFIIPACAIGAWHRRDRIWIVGRRIFSNSVNGTNRTIRGESREKKGVSCECRQTRLSRKSCGTGGEIFPDCNNQGLQGREETRNIGGIREERDQQSKRYSECFGGAYWQSEPSVGRVANGIPNRVDRLKGLGNAIVPQVAFELFKAIGLLITTAKKQ